MSRFQVPVSADRVGENLNTPGIVVVEPDEDASAYDGGHLTGAVRLDWKLDLQDSVIGDVVNKKQFGELLSSKGISNDDTIVLYGGNDNRFAAHAYRCFKLYGHGSVKLLDGGRKKWELDGCQLTTDDAYSARQPGTGTKGQDLSIRAFRDEARAAIANKNLVDVRTPDEFSGKLLAPAHLPREQSQRAGHIPTARSVPWSKAANGDAPSAPTSSSRSCAPRRASMARKEAIADCRIGERSSHTCFVLRERLGHEQVKNYDGSWTEYGSMVGVTTLIPSTRLCRFWPGRRAYLFDQWCSAGRSIPLA